MFATRHTIWTSLRPTLLALSLVALLFGFPSAGPFSGPTPVAAAATSVRVNAGSASAYTDAQGNTWTADCCNNTGYTYSTDNAVTGTSDPTLYQSGRWYTSPGFTYTFSLPNGTYNVVLKFAEVYFSQKGKRAFNVALNGQQVLSNFDVLAQVAPNAALDKTFSATVSNGQLQIAFSIGTADNPMVSAIQILPASSASVAVSVDRTARVGTSQMALGVTHEHYSLDSWGDATAVAHGQQLLQASAVYQNQHIMGWGGSNPEPSPGVYDWSSLDARLTLMRQTGGTPVITLCCSPDWMWGGAAGATDWSQLGTPPTHEHYADFAALAAQVARRYPDVKYFQVWNELKGFWNGGLNRWDYEGYTTFYNQVYDALKAVSPDIKVGGPYVVMDSWGNRSGMSNPSNVSGPYGTLDQRPLDVISYWLANKHGADFITVDGMSRNWDGVQITDEFTATQKFADVATWIHQHTSLPLWWAEWYATPWGSSSEWDHNHQNAVMATTLVRMINSGVSVPLRWQPQGQYNAAYQGDTESIWRDTRQAGGGQPFPFYSTAKAFHDVFGPGTALYRATSSSSAVQVLASASHTLVINTQATALTITVNGSPMTLAGYEVRLL